VLPSSEAAVPGCFIARHIAWIGPQRAPSGDSIGGGPGDVLCRRGQAGSVASGSSSSTDGEEGYGKPEKPMTELTAAPSPPDAEVHQYIQVWTDCMSQVFTQIAGGTLRSRIYSHRATAASGS
jgi:hypothetical protein